MSQKTKPTVYTRMQVEKFGQNFINLTYSRVKMFWYETGFYHLFLLLAEFGLFQRRLKNLNFGLTRGSIHRYLWYFKLFQSQISRKRDSFYQVLIGNICHYCPCYTAMEMDVTRSIQDFNRVADSI
jgi:hypothetical protein